MLKKRWGLCSISMPMTKKGTKKTATKKTSSLKAKKKVAKVMHEYKEGTLHSRSKKGPQVKSRKQAVAIALSEAGVSNRKKRSSSKARRKS